MKKQILLLFVTVISVAAWSQTTPRFGVKAGLSSASMRGDAVNNLNNLLDFADGMITTHNRTGFLWGGTPTFHFPARSLLSQDYTTRKKGMS